MTVLCLGTRPWNHSSQTEEAAGDHGDRISSSWQNQGQNTTGDAQIWVLLCWSDNSLFYTKFVLQAQLQAAQIEKEEWQNRAAKFEDTCETLKVLSRWTNHTRNSVVMIHILSMLLSYVIVLWFNSLQRSLSKEEEIKLNYEAKLQKLYSENAALTDQLECVLQERNIAVEERNELIKERNAFSLQAQQEFERAER